MEFEYLVIRFNVIDDDVQGMLNHQARTGWRLMHTITIAGDTIALIFERRTRRVSADVY